MMLPKPSMKICANSAVILFLFLLSFASAKASDEKDLWAKNNAERLMIAPSEPPVVLNNGGPDSYGYYFYDSQDSATNAPHYRWVDIVAFHDTVKLDQDDQNAGTYVIGFPFYYYGQTFTTFRVCSNGWLSFNSTSTAYLNRPIPTADDPNNLLAVFWDDLVPDTGVVYKHTNNVDTCIVAWYHFRRYQSGGDYTFEVILTRDGNITFQYRLVNGVLNSHSIGIENSTGTTGLQYICNSYKNETGAAIYFGLRPPHYATHDVMPASFRAPPGRGTVGNPFNAAIRFTNAGSISESFNGRLKIFHNGQQYDQIRRITSLRPDSSILSSYPQFIPGEPGSYELEATTDLSTDRVPRNDTTRMTYFAYSGIYSVNFEGGSSSFLGNHDWQWGTATRGPSTAHSGVRLWGTILDGNYSVGPLLSTLYSDTLFIGDAATLTFWNWYDIEALFDGGNVKISTDDGITWTLLIPAGGYDGILSTSFQNPLGGQQAFYGVSGGWQMETFDLSSYSGTTAIIRFDFGSDDSGNSYGWYIDDFSILGGGVASPGWLRGVVTDSSSNPISRALINAGRRSRNADTLGRYFMEMLPGVYAVTASAPYFNSFTSAGITVAAGDTTILNFILTAPNLEVDTTAIDTAMVQGRIINFSRQLTNPGNGPLDFNARVNLQRRDRLLDRYGKANSTKGDDPVNPPRLADFGDEVFIFNSQISTEDDGCVGVEFDGQYFWVTGRHGIDQFHKLHKFDRDGNLIASFEQNTHSLWGWRDLAFDGRFLYASDENGLAVIDTSTGQQVDTLHMPSSIPAPLRALAYDPASDHFWAANFSSNIIEFDRTGQTIHSFPNDRHIFGLAWDDASRDGPWLWVFSQDGDPPMEVSQFDPRAGVYTSITFNAVDHNGGEPDLAGGACFTTEWDQSKGILFCLVMGRTTLYDSFDNVQGYEITPFPRWLTVAPASGTIAPSQSQEITIRIDFSDSLFVPDSLYRGAITIQNNSANAPVVPVNVGLVSGVGDNDRVLPREFTLYQNYPNPFNSSTLIRFALPHASSVKLDVFNILGQKVTTLLDGDLKAGFYSVHWDARSAASGLYFYRLSIDNEIKTRQMMLLK